jgi:hypothetical protein
MLPFGVTIPATVPPFYGPLVGVCWGTSILKELGGSLFSLSKRRSGFQVSLKFRLLSQPPTCEDGTECSETLAFNIQTPGKYPEENIPYVNIS